MVVKFAVTEKGVNNRGLIFWIYHLTDTKEKAAVGRKLKYSIEFKKAFEFHRCEK